MTEASMSTAEGKEEVLDLIEPIMVVEQGSSQILLNNGNDEEKVLSKTEILTNNDDQDWDASNLKDRHDNDNILQKSFGKEHRQ